METQGSPPIPSEPSGANPLTIYRRSGLSTISWGEDLRTVKVTCSCGAESVGGQLGEAPPGWSVAEMSMNRKYREFDLCPECTERFAELELGILKPLPDIIKIESKKPTDWKVGVDLFLEEKPLKEPRSKGLALKQAVEDSPIEASYRKKRKSFAETSLEVIKLMDEGLSHADIAARLGMTKAYLYVIKGRIKVRDGKAKEPIGRMADDLKTAMQMRDSPF